MNHSQNTVPRLTYCKENVEFIYRRYREMISMGAIQDPYLRASVLSAQFNFIEIKKKQLSPGTFREKGWRAIREDTFEELIRLLQKKGWLNLWDDRLLYSSNEAIAHSMSNFLGSPLDIDLRKYDGKYRTFNTATTNKNIVLKGSLFLKYNAECNYIETTHRMIYSPNGENSIYTYRGFINFLRKDNNLIWSDRLSGNDEESIRQSRIEIILREDNKIIMDAVMFLNFKNIHYMRKMRIDNCLSDFPSPDQEFDSIPYDSDKIPTEHRDHLTPESSTNLQIRLS